MQQSLMISKKGNGSTNFLAPLKNESTIRLRLRKKYDDVVVMVDSYYIPINLKAGDKLILEVKELDFSAYSGEKYNGA